MKKVIYSFWTVCMVLFVAVLTGCSADKYDGIDPNGRPDANEIDATITVDQETNTYKLVLNNKGYYPVWTVNVGKNPKVSTTNGFTGVISEAGTYQVEVRMGNRNGLSEGSKVYEIVIENSLGGDVFTGYQYDTDFNLWKDCTITEITTWFANNDWGEISAPAIDASNESISFECPAELGTQQWQGQVHINTDIATNTVTNYDFSIFLVAAAGHPGVTVKLQDKSNDGVFYCENKVQLEPGIGKCFYVQDMPGLDISEIQLTLDFGGGTPGTEIQISNIVLKDHANDDGTVFPPAVEFDDHRNLFVGFSVVNQSTWFADGNWNSDAVAQPAIDLASDGFSLTIPTNTGWEQWQGQVHLWTDVAVSADKRYDFCVTILSSEDHPGVTVKVQKGDSLGASTDDDNTFFCADRVGVKANVPYTYYFEDLPGFDTSNIQLCFDFGGGVSGSEVIISNLHLQEHKK